MVSSLLRADTSVDGVDVGLDLGEQLLGRLAGSDVSATALDGLHGPERLSGAVVRTSSICATLRSGHPA